MVMILRTLKPGGRLLCLLVLTLSSAWSADYEFTLHHFLGPNSPAQTVLLEPWAERVRADSDGRIDIRIHPSMSLGGRPSDLVDQLERGDVDMIWTLAGYTPGRFPRTEVFELPAVHFRSAYATNRAIIANEALIAPDYEGFKPLLVHVHAGNAIHLRDRDVTRPADLRDLRLRTPSRTGGWLIDTWQAEPVALPLPEVPTAIQSGRIDGALIPFEVYSAINLQDDVSHSVLGSDGSRFGTSVFLFLMNEDRFNALPEELQAVIDDNIGLELAKEMGYAWDDLEVPGRMSQYDQLTKIDLEQIYAFEDLSEQVVARWIEDMTEQGIDGRVLVDSARKYVARYSRIITTLE